MAHGCHTRCTRMSHSWHTDVTLVAHGCHTRGPWLLHSWHTDGSHIHICYTCGTREGELLASKETIDQEGLVVASLRFSPLSSLGKELFMTSTIKFVNKEKIIIDNIIKSNKKGNRG